MKVLKFTASWCGPCKSMNPYWDDVIEASGFDVEVIDIDVDSETTLQHNIKSVPTMLILDDKGTVLANKTGALSQSQLTEWFGEYVNTTEA